MNNHLIDHLTQKARDTFATQDLPRIVVSPYRFNPLGAHIDHQGGKVLARTLNQYSIGAFYPSQDASVAIASLSFGSSEVRFNLSDAPNGENWQRYAMAAGQVFSQWAKKQGHTATGFNMVVEGTMVGAGLSSSASIILAYLVALADVNALTVKPDTLVELTRQVENEHMGLNNGVQDQMSVVFGDRKALSALDVETVTAEHWKNPSNMEEVSWVVCYSGFSRELIASGFNDRVSECREAARLLQSTAERLGDVALEYRAVDKLAALPEHLARRASHVYSEMARVEAAKSVWERGDWQAFGALMNASCASSIEHYECGSEPMHYLHSVALTTSGVFGSRFSGGGYGGCLILLADARQANAAGDELLSAFLQRYPEKAGVANVFIAEAEGAVRVL